MAVRTVGGGRLPVAPRPGTAPRTGRGWSRGRGLLDPRPGADVRGSCPGKPGENHAWGAAWDIQGVPASMGRETASVKLRDRLPNSPPLGFGPRCLGRLCVAAAPGAWPWVPADTTPVVPSGASPVPSLSEASAPRRPPPPAPGCDLGPPGSGAGAGSSARFPLRAPGSAALRGGGGGGGGARGRDPPASPSWSPGNPASAAWPPPAPAPAAARRSLGAPQPARPLRWGLRSAGRVPARLPAAAAPPARVAGTM